MRTESTRNLVDAARAAGVRRIVAQSYAHVYAPVGGWVKSEKDPLNLAPDVPAARRRNVEAIQALERAVLETPGIEGVALRYGTIYGPGTAYANDGSIAHLVRIRHFPIVGDGHGMTSFVHVDDAAAATVLAVGGPAGVYNIVDDEPAPRSEWVAFYAELLGTRAASRAGAADPRARARALHLSLDAAAGSLERQGQTRRGALIRTTSPGDRASRSSCSRGPWPTARTRCRRALAA